MIVRTKPFRRGLTLIELMLALAITAMVAAAISGMLTAISTGEHLRRDNRMFIMRAHAAKTRLGAYLSRSRCVLDANGADAVLWLEDSRGSGTVHASEIRWLIFNTVDGTLDVHFVDMPDEWTNIAKDLQDNEYDSDADWSAVWNDYDGQGYISTLTLVDGLQSVSVSTDQPDPLDSVEVEFDLDFASGGTGSPLSQTITVTIFERTSFR